MVRFGEAHGTRKMHAPTQQLQDCILVIQSYFGPWEYEQD